MLEAFLTDVRYASRSLRTSPGFTTVAVLTLGLGIGLNVAVFTVMNASLFKPFPFVDRSERVLYLERPGVGFSYSDFEDWRLRTKSLDGMAASTAWLASFSDARGVPEPCAVTLISANGFEIIGQRPLLGRNFAPSDGAPGAAPVAILSDALWERRYGRDPSIIGRTVRLEVSGMSVLQQDTATVIGVMAPGFSFPLDQDLWVPLVPPPTSRAHDVRNITFLFGRVADGVDIQSARAELEAIGRQSQRAEGPTERRPFSVQSFNEHFVGARATLVLTSMAGAVGFVLLIACANVANLMLARAISRSRDVSVRIALGAGSQRIVRQLLTESVLVSAAGGVVGWGVARLGVRAYELSGYAPFNYKHYVNFAMDYRVLWYLVAISIGTGLLFGLAPAVRLAKLDINTALQAGRRGVAGDRRGRHLSTFLVAGEMALAVVLLAGAGVMIRSVLNIYTAPIGADTTTVLMSELGLPVARYSSAESQIAFHERLKERLEAVPGVDSVAIADRYPTQSARRIPYELPGASVDHEHRPMVFAVVVGPDYFRTVGATVLSGREFTNADGASGPAVALVNNQFANETWPGENPLGKQVRLFDTNGGDAWRTVVGVVSNVVQNARRESAPVVYLSYRQSPAAFMYVFARARVLSEGLGSSFHREIQALDSMLPASFRTLADRVNRGDRDRGLYGALLVIFAGFGLALASVGLYAVITHVVSQRTQEIGIRTAMGATARDVCTLVFAQGMRPVGIGLPIGLVASLALNRVLASQLVQVSPFDPTTLVVTSGVLIVSAILGCVIPARHAMRVDPIVALRHE